MNANRRYLAFDLGASNVRWIIGHFDGHKLVLDAPNHFENGAVRVGKHLFWDILALFQNIKDGLQKAARSSAQNLIACGIDTWGVDFGLLDRKGNLLGNPFCYRDPHTEGMMEKVFVRMPKEQIFQTTGIQFMRVNTLYQLFALLQSHSSLLNSAETLLMIPDLIGYWLTGRKACEYTIASTTQLLDVRARQWAFPLIQAVGIPDHIFPEIISPGKVLDELSTDICDELRVKPFPIIATGSHDTAAAVASVPAIGNDFAFLSSGTWGLLGIELRQPLLADKVYQYGFGNEGGVNETIRLLKNMANMWLIQECRRTWALEGESHTWDELIAMAEQAKPFLAFIDPDASDFMLPGDMPNRIRFYCEKTKQQVPQVDGEVIRICLESMALKYRYTFEQLADILGESPAVFHIVGGASRNRLLNQFAANALRRTVISGPSEATALGNLIMQMQAMGDLVSLEEARRLIQTSFPVETFEPQHSDLWEEKYHQFLKKTGLDEAIAM